MKRNFGFLWALVASVLLQGCLGAGGSSAPPPTNFQVKAQDSRVTASWDMLPGVEYWIFKAAGTGVTPQNCSVKYLCSTSVKVTSPVTIWSLYNGIDYSFTINARTGGGPGGQGTPAVQVMAGPAGKVWSQGNVLDASPNMRGVAYGASGAKFVAAGEGGALFSGMVTTGSTGTTEITWTNLASLNPLPGTTFNAVNYDAYRAKFYSAGAGGAVITHTPSVSTAWTQQTSNTTENLYAMANNGAGFVVATGANGAIIYSSDGTTWTSLTKGTNALYGVTYGYDSVNAVYRFVAVGASGTLLWSTDGATWTDVTDAAITTDDLKGVTYGGLDSSGRSVFVAVGANGTVLTSEDGMTWTLRASTTIPTTANLNAVTYFANRRFVAVADDGTIYYSDYYVDTTTVGNGAVTWNKATVSSPASSLYAVAAGGLYDFLAVGASGTNLYADRSDY